MVEPRPITWGKRDALVTVTVFEGIAQDGLATPPIREHVRKLLDGDVRFVWRPASSDTSLPIGGFLARAAMGAHELGGDDAFWAFHDYFAAPNVREEISGWVASALSLSFQQSLATGGTATTRMPPFPHTSELWTHVVEAAKAAKLDPALFRKRLEDGEWARELDSLERQIWELTQIKGDPSTNLVDSHALVNGVPFSFGRITPGFDALLAEAQRRARAAVEQAGAAEPYVEACESNARAGARATLSSRVPIVDRFTRWNVPLSGLPVDGPGDARVTVLLHCDLVKEACRRAYDHLRTLQKANAGYRTAFAVRPTRSEACGARVGTVLAAVHALRPEAFFTIADALAERPLPSWSDVLRSKELGCPTDADVAELAKKARIPFAELRRAMSPAATATWSEATRRREGDLENDGFFVNGREVMITWVDPRDTQIVYTELARVLEEERAQTRPYDELIRNGYRESLAAEE